jgi:hypothetical protein
MAKDPPKFREKDIPVALATIIQALIVQLMDANALTVEQGQRVFDGALKKAKKSQDAPDVSRLIQHIHDSMPWDKLFAASAQKKKSGQ